MSGPEYSIIGGVLTARINVRDRDFENNVFVKRLEIEEGVENIGYRSFSGCIHLEEVQFPKSLKRIGGGAFKDCVNLTSAILPPNLMFIGRGAFEGCTNLRGIVVPSSVETQGPNAFPDDAVKSCSMSERPFKALGVPTIDADTYKWPDDRIVQVEYKLFDPYAKPRGKKHMKGMANGKVKGKMAYKGYSSDGKWVGTLKRWGQWVEDEDNERIVAVVGNKDEVEIKLVYLGSGSGLCTKAVASVLYAVIDRLNTHNMYPVRGKVYIESKNGCAAFNCYNRAFRMNGYQLTERGMADYKRFVATQANAGVLSQTLMYYSQRQMLRRGVHENEQGVATYKMYVQKLRQAKLALDRAPSLGPIGVTKRARFVVRADSSLGKTFAKAFAEEVDIERVYQRLRTYLPREWSVNRGKAYLNGWNSRHKQRKKRKL